MAFIEAAAVTLLAVKRTLRSQDYLREFLEKYSEDTFSLKHWQENWLNIVETSSSQVHNLGYRTSEKMKCKI